MTDDPGAGRAVPRRRSPRRRRARRAILGASLGRAFSLWTRNLLPFSLLALMIYWPFGIANYWVHARFADSGIFQEMQGVERMKVEGEERDVDVDDVYEFGILVFALSVLEATIMKLLLTGTLTVLVVRRLQEQPVDLGRALKEGLMSVPRAIGVTLMVLLIVGLPLIVTLLLTFFLHGVFSLLVLFVCVFGAVLWVKWFVAVPVAVLEKLPVSVCLGRSSALTRERGWSIFWMVVLMAILIWVMQQPFSLAVTWLVRDPMTRYVADGVWVPVLAFILFAPLRATFTAVVYHALCEEKDGPATDRLARVFE